MKKTAIAGEDNGLLAYKLRIGLYIFSDNKKKTFRRTNKKLCIFYLFSLTLVPQFRLVFNVSLLLLFSIFPECKSTEYKCRAGNCIDSARRCDNIRDCPDGDDEDDRCRKYSLALRYSKPMKTYIYIQSLLYVFVYHSITRFTFSVFESMYMYQKLL